MFGWVSSLFCNHKWKFVRWVEGESLLLGKAAFKEYECLRCGKIDREGPYRR